MHNHEEYEKLINGLNEVNFNQLIKEYAKEYYDTKELHISDGPYDGGLDLEYFKKEQKVKRNIQITVTDSKNKSSFEKKLFNDVKNSANNRDKYSYQSNLDFYTSASLTQERKNKYITEAEVEYNIDLKIIDAKKLSHNMDEYSSIKQTLSRH